MWNRLRGLQHPNIVHLLWVYVTRSHAVICSDAMTYGGIQYGSQLADLFQIKSFYLHNIAIF